MKFRVVVQSTMVVLKSFVWRPSAPRSDQLRIMSRIKYGSNTLYPPSSNDRSTHLAPYLGRPGTSLGLTQPRQPWPCRGVDSLHHPRLRSQIHSGHSALHECYWPRAADTCACEEGGAGVLIIVVKITPCWRYGTGNNLRSRKCNSKTKSLGGRSHVLHCIS